MYIFIYLVSNYSHWTSCLTATDTVDMPWGCGNLSKVSNRVVKVRICLFLCMFVCVHACACVCICVCVSCLFLSSCAVCI